MRLDGRIALITGGGTGIGRATALLFTREGARVLLVGRREEPLQAVAAEAGGEERAAAVCTADVCDDAAIRSAVARVVRAWGGLDILVNNAGEAPAWTPIHETPDDTWRRALDTNLTGAFRAVRAALPHLIERRGAIVNVASTSALRAFNSVASYSAAKAGLIALTRCIAAEYGGQGVRCNCVVPSWVETPMTASFLEDPETRRQVAGRHALQRVADPDDVARAILYLAGDDAAFVTGVAHPVDGGLSAL